MVGLKPSPQNKELLACSSHLFFKEPDCKQLGLVLSVLSEENTVMNSLDCLLSPLLKHLGDTELQTDYSED